MAGRLRPELSLAQPPNSGKTRLGNPAGAGSRREQLMLRALLVLLAPPAASAQTFPSGIQPGWEVNQWHPLNSSITLIVDLHPEPSASLRVFVNEVDLTALFEIEGDRWSFPLRLNKVIGSGEHTLTVYLVEASGQWRELDTFTLRLRTPAGFERASFSPAVNLSVDGQWEGERVGTGDGQGTSSASLQATLATEHRRGSFQLNSTVEVIGVPQREAALRFTDLGARAPRVDLASYLIASQLNKTRLLLGHLQFGEHRLIAQGFAARGVALQVPLAAGVTLALATTGGSSQVGWDDLLGLSQTHHRMRSATLNLTNLLPRTWGTTRLALTWLDGSLLPRTSFNQGAVTSAERSQGGGVLLSFTTPSQRLGVEGGWARMRLDPAFDAELEGGLETEPVGLSRSDARYLEVQATLLDRQGSDDALPASLTLAVQHQRVDPLYRSVAAATQADVDLLSGQLAAQLGAATAQLTWERTYDHLRRLPSVLGSGGEREGIHLALPLSQMPPGRAWLPSLPAGWEHTRTTGRSRDDTLFPPDTVPDVDTRTLTTALSWAIASWQLSYQYASSLAQRGEPVRAVDPGRRPRAGQSKGTRGGRNQQPLGPAHHAPPQPGPAVHRPSLPHPVDHPPHR